ncbi:hypothetical protein Y032_0276g1096 [Ancylostoma ceylanicum]|uniref:DDE Tnp4 domain-containing protein n=1 Tax=Ancylostoma ceylanicum TaxID=53326 RepID=A0A016S7G9_9BILA|nr:hypothetical protein Y032_0276g1096 [Ancylostoma ceylanicum]
MAAIFMRTRQRRSRKIDYQRIHPILFSERNERIFYSEYRFRPTGVEKIVRMLSPLLPENGFEPWEILKLNQVLFTLRYLATNSHQTVIADVFGVSQNAVSDVITRVADVLNHPMIEEKFLRSWVSDEQWCLCCSRGFARQSKFTNVVGCEDGCLIRIQRPINNGNHYYCSKAYCAVNLVAVVDTLSKFTCINCGFEGRHHDSFIWLNLNRLLGSSKKDVHGLGIDSWVMQGFPTPGA